MEIKGTDQIYHILQNLSNLEMAFLDYSDNNKDFVEYHTSTAMPLEIIIFHDFTFR